MVVAGFDSPASQSRSLLSDSHPPFFPGKDREDSFVNEISPDNLH